VFVLVLTAAAILIASLVLRRSGGRAGGVLPGVR
jgi:hypothetical protein